jgi:hypothetical protein
VACRLFIASQLLSSTPLKEKRRVPHFYCGIVERVADYCLDGHAKTNHLAERMVDSEDNSVGFFIYAVL